MFMKIRKKSMIGLFLYVLFVLINTLIPYSTIGNKIIAVLTLALSLIWVYECANNTCFLIMSMFIAYSNYSIVVGIYLDEKLRPKYLYPQITDIRTYGIGISILFITMLLLVCLTPRIVKSKYIFSKHFIKYKNENKLLFYIATISFFLIVLVGYSGGNNGRGTSSPLYEYDSIFLILMFYFSAREKKNIGICAIACMTYSLTSLVNGTRIEALICILIFVLCFIKKEIKPSTVFLGMLAGIVVFSTVGVLRGNWSLLLNGDNSIISEIFRNKFVFDTCTHAYFPMLCMIEEFKKFSFEKSLHYLGAFLLSVFAGQSRVVDGDLIKVVAQKFYHNFGGVTPGFFYVWFSFAGPAVFAVIVRFYMKFIENIEAKPSEFKCCAALYFISTVPRWYLYGPWSMTRGVLVCVVIFYAFQKLHKFLKVYK